MREQPFRVAVSARGDRARVLIAYTDYVVLLEGDGSAPQLAFSKAWRWHDYTAQVLPRLRIDGRWFILPLDSTSAP